MSELRPSPAPHAPSPIGAPPALVHDPVALPAEAARHFAALLAFETDCWDVHDALLRGATGFVVLDVRSPEVFATGHVPGAINLPHGRFSERTLGALPTNALLVVYCAGPHCNGADRAALRAARLGYRVKKMIGGVEGWKDEGYALETDD